MSSLRADIGRSGSAPAAVTVFSGDEVTPAHFDAFRITIRERAPFYKEMLPYLRERGRDDLAGVIERKLARND